MQVEVKRGSDWNLNVDLSERGQLIDIGTSAEDASLLQSATTHLRIDRQVYALFALTPPDASYKQMTQHPSIVNRLQGLQVLSTATKHLPAGRLYADTRLVFAGGGVQLVTQQLGVVV